MELKVHGIFIDISKALDKVWHDGLIFKLYQNGICGEMINILDRKRRIVLKGQCLSWVDIWAGVPQRSILRSLFFNIPQMIILSQLKDLMSLLSTFDLFQKHLYIENMSFKFYCLNVKSFTSFY